ncbi:MAG: MgtC/SapB family protein [Candidatus Yonathbacteria bacterium]|nr:MgtC/SapB family protein [Candidatus Yonathbacteria bacterium]
MDIATLFSNQDIEIILKLFIALLLGMSLGIERAIAGKTAGMRTYGLVTMGSALFVIVGVLASGGYGNSVALSESTRFTASIISGIGFIGAGLIFFKDAKVSGITTAAGIWVAAGIGVAIGYGFYMLAVITTIFALFVFTSLWYIENKIKSFARLPDEE